MFYNSILRGKFLDFWHKLKVASGENKQGLNRYDFALEMSNFCPHNANTSSYSSIPIWILIKFTTQANDFTQQSKFIHS